MTQIKPKGRKRYDHLNPQLVPHAGLETKTKEGIELLQRVKRGDYGKRKPRLNSQLREEGDSTGGTE